MPSDLYRALVGYLLLFVLGAGAVGYCAGHTSGTRSAKLEANQVRIDTARIRREAREEARKEAEAVSARAIERSLKAREERRELKRHVEIKNDSTVAVDGIIESIPRPVVSLLRSSDKTARTDSLTIVSLQRENTTLKEENVALREERDAWAERAKLQKPPRIGWKTGLAVGLGAGAIIGATVGGGLVAAIAAIF